MKNQVDLNEMPTNILWLKKTRIFGMDVLGRNVLTLPATEYLKSNLQWGSSRNDCVSKNSGEPNILIQMSISFYLARTSDQDLQATKARSPGSA